MAGYRLPITGEGVIAENKMLCSPKLLEMKFLGKQVGPLDNSKRPPLDNLK